MTGSEPEISENDLAVRKTFDYPAKPCQNWRAAFVPGSPAGEPARPKMDGSLNLMVAEIIKEFATETIERNIVWQIRALPVVQADPAILKRVMVSLIASAVKSTDRRTETIIEVGWLPDVKKETVIFIQDNAAGFDAHYAAKLFPVFKRLHSEYEFESAGSELARVQRIIKLHGGRSWSTGVVDNGSTFYFSLPNGESQRAANV